MTELPGILITLEGGEGTGKTTQAAILESRLTEAGHDVHVFREPGGTDLGDQIRCLLLDPGPQYPFPCAELLLYEASRAQLVEREILPRLRAGGVVVCDRFADSSLAYQGYGRDLDKDLIRTINSWATHGLVPALTIVFDADVDLAMERATQGGADRLELELDDFHQRVREGFLDIARLEPGRVKVVRADQMRGVVAAEVWEHVCAMFESRGIPG